MFDLLDIVYDADLSECMTIYRSTGTFVAGGFKEAITEISATGVVTIADDEALAQVHEGDRIKGAIMFVTDTPIYETLAQRPNGNGGGTSDEIKWNNQKYRVAHVAIWKKYGFYAAVLVRMKGE